MIPGVRRCLAVHSARPAFEDEGRQARQRGSGGGSRQDGDGPTRRIPADAPHGIGTPLDRVLIAVIVSALALPPGECQINATGRSGTRDDGSTWSPPQTVNPVRSPKGEVGS
ncbi:hypothetical protein EASAB2608_04244 [Streptomyces sp. EAS-AB2608]|nr:hypothetical protein EASAB2608_04244 [Streptomyces sp. EAS-AB2608]